MEKFTKNNKGFVLLYTVLIASIILAITIGITSISYQEIILSSSAREANTAFFAADTGSECALYADLNLNLFNQSQATFTCNGQTITTVSTVAPAKFNFELDLDNGTNCAKVTVEKDPVALSNLYSTSTRIVSLGYNMSCVAVDNFLSNPPPRLVERAIRATYGVLIPVPALPVDTGVGAL